MNEPASSGIVKKLLDPMARENPANHDLKQHFQDGYDLLTPTVADTLREQEKTGSARSVAPGFAGRMYARLILLWDRFGLSCSSSSPCTYLPYALVVLSHIIGAIVNDEMEWMSRFWNGKLEKQRRMDKKNDDENIEAQTTTKEEAGNNVPKTEHLFVDYVSTPPSEKRAHSLVSDA